MDAIGHALGLAGSMTCEILGHVDAVFAAMTPDIEWDESEGTSYGGVYHGREAIVSNVFPSEMARLDRRWSRP
jgi:hypothetical protein